MDRTVEYVATLLLAKFVEMETVEQNPDVEFVILSPVSKHVAKFLIKTESVLVNQEEYVIGYLEETFVIKFLTKNGFVAW